MKIDKSLMSGSTEMLVLSLLQKSDKYGYQMISDLSIMSDNAFELKEGTLYPILHGLEKRGALKSYTKQSPSGKERKYYSITNLGRRLLDEKVEAWNSFALAVKKVVTEK